MCVLTKYIKKKTATVFKIVAKEKETGKYWSVAMGFIYPKKGYVPEVVEQKALTINWSKRILYKNEFLYKKNMVGRTAGFVKKEDVSYLLDSVTDNLFNSKFEIVIVKVTLSGALMEGTYETGCNDCEIIAGKYIERMKEV